MTIEFMKKIDYWIGIPLCFLFSGINYIWKLFSYREKKEKEVAKVLFIKLSEMGSIILSYPLIKHFKEKYPRADVFFLSFKENKALLEILRIISTDKILTIRKSTVCLFVLDTLRAVKKLRKENIDVAFDLEFFSRFTVLFSFVIGAKRRIGFYHYALEGLYRGNLLTHKIQYNPMIHISKSFLSFLQVVEFDRKDTPDLKRVINREEVSLPEFIVSEEKKERMLKKLQNLGINRGAKLFLVNPGEGTLPLREWPLENFIVLCRRILENDRNFIVVVGKADFSHKAKRFCEAINSNRCINLNGKTTLSELLILFAIAEVLITYDCGLAHLASLTPIKKFVIFGPESPIVFAPLGETYVIYINLICSPCFSIFNHRSSACKNNRCLKMIRPDEVYKAMKSILSIEER
ncbi:MAG: glycosyltransferase family 9 protein [Candidatus Omnitrophica bacterium]|nr:glycosyltransferase family 9 protein [Candidatus Omnitrophota bacterium]